MWTKVKLLSTHHPNPTIRQYAKHLLAKMNSGNRAHVEVNNLVMNHYHEAVTAYVKSN